MTGHKPGQPEADVSPLAGVGYSWADYVDALAADSGGLAKVAERLWGLAPHIEDVASIERGLRRLKARGQRDGGDHGRRLLHLFGLPKPVAQRLRWMGIYHGRFADLPVTISLEVLRAWNRPPVSESSARVWLELGFASAFVRSNQLTVAKHHLDRIVTTGAEGARIEALLLETFVVTQTAPKDGERALALLDKVKPLLSATDLTSHDRDNWHARWLDQRAHIMTSKPNRSPESLRAAQLLYEAISEGAPAFATTKRETGLAFIRWKLGDSERAVVHAQRAISIAGDGGFLRLRASALNLLARILGPNGAQVRNRAEQIAQALADDDLYFRVTRR